MQQCDMCHPPPASQLPLPRSYNGTECHGIVQTVSMSSLCPCPHTTHNPTHHGAQSVVGLAAGRAGQRSQSCSSAPRPGPPRPQHGTRHGLSFSLSAPARPSPAAAPGGSRTPHSHDPTYPAVCWLASMQSPPGPSTTTITPCKGCSCRRCGGGGAGPCWRQPSPAPTWHRSAGQGGPGPALAAHNNSPTTAERENPRKNTIRTTFAHLTHHNLGRGHSRVGWARLAWASLSGAAHFLESGAISETLTRQSRSGAALGFAELTAGTAAAVTSRRHLSGNNTTTTTNTPALNIIITINNHLDLDTAHKRIICCCNFTISRQCHQTQCHT